MEGQELYNLVYGRTKVPRRTPVPDLSRITNENFERNPLANFSMEKMRTRQVYELIANSVEKSRRREFLEKSRDLEEEKIARLPGSFYLKIAQVYSGSIPTVGLPVEWEENILSMIPSAVRIKYSNIVEKIIGETRQKYVEEMHKLGVNTVLRQATPEVHVEPLPIESPSVHGGRTKNYEKYLKNREEIARQYFLSHKLIKVIKSKAYTD